VDTLWQAVLALVPSVGVGLVFFIAIRSVVRADRNERAAMAELDRAAPAQPQTPPVQPSGP